MSRHAEEGSYYAYLAEEGELVLRKKPMSMRKEEISKNELFESPMLVLLKAYKLREFFILRCLSPWAFVIQNWNVAQTGLSGQWSSIR